MTEPFLKARGTYLAAYRSALYSEYVSPGLDQLDTSVTVHLDLINSLNIK